MSRQGQPPRDVIPVVEPICVECGKMGVRVMGSVIYPKRPDLASRIMWRCPCGAYVGSHPGTEIPLGYPAGPQTRGARLDAHAVFDALWKAKMTTVKPDGHPYAKHEAREAAYQWLMKELGIDRAACHISMFDGRTARRVVALCAPIAKRINARANA